MSRPNYLNKIKKNILDAEYGTVFVAVDFVSIADKKTVNMSLLCLEEGLIRGLSRVYITKPNPLIFLKEYVIHILIRLHMVLK